MYQIIEIANVHGGSKDYLLSLIDEFSNFNNGFGIKFQPFKFDEIALDDFEWYSVYKKLYFNLNDWKEIINKASLTKDIWIDVFDKYSISIINDNHNNVYGLKLQASILYNKEVIAELKKIDLQQKPIILNISGLKIYEIKDLVLQFENDFNSSEIMLQVGFQGYPTKIEDSGISKIDILKNKFDNKIIFADHIDGNTEDSLWLPVFASSKNIFGIEKHVKHSSLETKYDFYSSIDVKKYKKFIDIINVYSKLNSKTFISDEEDLYLVKSDQKPILKVNKKKGDLLSWDDFTFKRSNSKGLNSRELNKYIGVGYCLTRDLNINDSINDFNLKKVTTATIVAARLKSSRLKRKALLKIGNLSSIEYCLKNALKFNDINFTVLATSNLNSDDELKHETFNSQVIFRKGDPHDVVKRYLDIIDELKIDVVVRVTGDMPFVSNDILQILLKSHYNSGADYTVGKDAAVGTNLEIINSAALIEVKKHFKSADYSEYMSWYFQNNPDYFKLNFVELPDYLIRNYRLTLDYQEDLDMFNIIDKHFTDNDLEGNVTELFNFLDKNPEVSELNNHITLKYKTDQDLIKKLNEATKINAV